MEHNQPIIKIQSKQTGALLFICLLSLFVLGPANLAPMLLFYITFWVSTRASYTDGRQNQLPTGQIQKSCSETLCDPMDLSDHHPCLLPPHGKSIHPSLPMERSGCFIFLPIICKDIENF